MKARVQYLDILKAIAIFLVVFCHFVLLPGTVTANILMCACWMAVPTFFMVNGALLFARPLDWKKHLTKTLTVYLVLVAWKLIYMLTTPFFTGACAEGTSIRVLLADFGINRILNYLFLFGELPGIINGHLWFIEALLAVYLVFPVLRIVYDYPDGVKNGSSQADSGTIKNTFTGRHVLWFIAAASLICTNGLHSLEILGQMLRAVGIPFQLSFDAVAAFQPFGKYGNMLGFFLLGALLGNPAAKGSLISESHAISDTAPSHSLSRIFSDGPAQRILAALMLVIGVISLWGVKWFLNGQPGWDGIMLEESYRHIPVILMAVGLFLLLRNVTIPGSQNLQAAESSAETSARASAAGKPGFYVYLLIRAVASRTLGIFYLHWVFGWMLVNPLAAFLVSHGLLLRGAEFGAWANVLKNFVLIIPALLVTLILEKIPVVRKLVQG